MNQYLRQMIELSEIDNDLLNLNPEMEHVKSAYLKIEAEKSSILEALEKIKKSIAGIDERIQVLEENLSRMAESQKEYEEKLKTVKKEKELAALSIENELRKEQIQYDNNEIERFNKTKESLVERLKENELKFQEFERKLSEAETSKELQLESIQNRKSNIEKARNDLVEKMDNKILSFYGKIRRWAKETTAVPVKDGACYGCYMKLNDQTYLEVLKGEDIITCPSCGRLIYFMPDN